MQLTKQYVGQAVTPDPYILLDTGSDTPGKAWYSGRIDTLGILMVVSYCLVVSYGRLIVLLSSDSHVVVCGHHFSLVAAAPSPPTVATIYTPYEYTLLMITHSVILTHLSTHPFTPPSPPPHQPPSPGLYNSTTLVFTYLVRPSDHTPSGLYLHCDCSDYFLRTFIHLNNSYVRTGTPTRPFVYAASAIVAEDASPTQRKFSSPFLGVIDNTPPVVTGVYANITVPSTGLIGDPPVSLQSYIPTH